MRIEIDTEKIKAPLGDLFGIFFEDLNHAADGGLYAELIQNRSFEFSPIDKKEYHALTAWERIGKEEELELRIETLDPVSLNNPHYLVMDIKQAKQEVGIQNIGFNTGIALKAGEKYFFSCYAAADEDFNGSFFVSLRDKHGKIYQKIEISFTQKDWKLYEAEFDSPVDDNAARLAITVNQTGKVFLDFVSLFPADTFLGRRNGMRKDIAELLKAMKPKFMRFPGGCLVHDGSLNLADRNSLYRWKNTIGPLKHRPARRNNWGYNQTLGLGFFEYFQFCEDIGAKPLPVLPGAYDPHHRRMAKIEELEEWILDALDLIEFANGSTDTKWGSKRAELGHEEPFYLEYLAIGNEEVGSPFFERYPYFHKAIKEKYPEIKLINTSGPFADGGEYERGWKSARECGSDFVDEHYYQTPEWFLANHHRYDTFSKEPKVFLGEYASWGNNWYHALAEASYMVGLEKNSQAVGLACYAPMLCNADYINWTPDMIWFNNHQAYGSANYYVQKLFMNHQGDSELFVELKDIPKPYEIKQPIGGAVYLGSNENKVVYYDIIIRDEDTKEEQKIERMEVDAQTKKVYLADILSKHYSLTMKAKELTGFKGFTIQFNYQDEKNKYIFSLGGWQNMDAILSEDINGKNSCLSQYEFAVEPEREYTIEIKVNKRKIETKIDGITYHQIENPEIIIEPIYCCASIEDKTKDIIIKAVNISDTKRRADILLKTVSEKTFFKTDETNYIKETKTNKTNYIKGIVYEMKGYDLDSENSFEFPERIKPIERKIQLEKPEFSWEFDKYSLTIFRLKQEEK